MEQSINGDAHNKIIYSSSSMSMLCCNPRCGYISFRSEVESKLTCCWWAKHFPSSSVIEQCPQSIGDTLAQRQRFNVIYESNTVFAEHSPSRIPSWLSENVTSLNSHFIKEYNLFIDSNLLVSIAWLLASLTLKTMPKKGGIAIAATPFCFPFFLSSSESALF